MFQRLIALLCLVTFTTACHRASTYIEPCVLPPPHPKEIHREKRCALFLPKDFSVCPFAPLSEDELKQDWGKEYYIASCFAEDFDLYRAITGFKRALCLLPEECRERTLELEYVTALAYFLGQKYVEVVYTVESTALVTVGEEFPAYADLLLILFESYQQLGKMEHAAHILQLIEKKDPLVAHKLTLLEAIKAADLDVLCREAQECQNLSYMENVVMGYQRQAKSVRKAEVLNAVLPGAGYWYVGLKQTGITAFVVNSLFIAAAASFFYHGNTAAGIITLSLESGWYFGGIYGAGLAAKTYNENMYCQYADKITQREKLFPVMMLKFTF